jgi:hypothetical protein
MLSAVGVKEHSGLSLDCERSGATMRCRVFQIQIRAHKEPADIDALIKARTQQFLKEIKETNGKFYAEMCDVAAKIANIDPRKESKTPEMLDTVEGLAALRSLNEMASRLKRVCDSRSEAAVVKFVEETVQAEDLDCAIAMFRPFELTFRRSPANKRQWVSNEGPHGECGIINVVVLEQEKDNDMLWTYTSRRTVTNKTGGTVLRCDGWDENPMVFSWKGETKMRRCNSIKFGF